MDSLYKECDLWVADECDKKVSTLNLLKFEEIEKYTF